MYCGDGIIDHDVGETCDDRNTKNGDGCSATCHVEAGWHCMTMTDSSICEQCGNGNWGIREACDDGNTKDGDGCSGSCQSYCDDSSDPEASPYVYGAVSFNDMDSSNDSQVSVDTCIDADHLSEVFCVKQGNGEYSLGRKTVTCSVGCADGACFGLDLQSIVTDGDYAEITYSYHIPETPDCPDCYCPYLVNANRSTALGHPKKLCTMGESMKRTFPVYSYARGGEFSDPENTVSVSAGMSVQLCAQQKCTLPVVVQSGKVTPP